MDYKENAILSTIFNSKLPSIFLLLLLIINIGSAAYVFDNHSSEEKEKSISIDILSIQVDPEISNNQIVTEHNSIQIIDSSKGNVKEDEYKSNPGGGITLDVVSPPEFLVSPGNLTFNKYVLGKSMSWEIKENKPDAYVLYENGVLIESELYINQIPITVDLDYLLNAVFHIEINFKQLCIFNPCIGSLLMFGAK